jgi:hypothetical protein
LCRKKIAQVPPPPHKQRHIYFPPQAFLIADISPGLELFSPWLFIIWIHLSRSLVQFTSLKCLPLLCCTFVRLKGTVQQDFYTSVFFRNGST